MATHGEINDYNTDLDFGKGPKNNNENKGPKKDWLKLTNGKNPIRIVTKAWQYQCHRGVKKVDDKGFGRKFPCTATPDCPLCSKGLELSTRFLYGVLDKRTGKYFVLDLPYQAFKQIRELAKNTEDWGDPTKYDLNILIDPEDKNAYYKVQPVSAKPLTPDQQKVRDDQMDIAYLKSKCEPVSVETLQKFLDKQFGAGAELHVPPPREPKAVANVRTAAAAKTNGNVRPAAKAVEASTGEEELAEIFPDFDNQGASV